LVAPSTALPIAALAVPFLLPVWWQAGAISAPVGAGEATFGAAFVLVRKAVGRHRRFFDPRNRFGKKRR
jgi:hypothetical protein